MKNARTSTATPVTAAKTIPSWIPPLSAETGSAPDDARVADRTERMVTTAAVPMAAGHLLQGAEHELPCE